MKKKNKTPGFAEWLLYSFLHKEEREFIAGDLKEFYLEMYSSSGRFRANSWYWGQIIKTFRHFLKDSIYGSTIMFKNYLKTAMRSLSRQKGYTLIKISGLAIGLAVCTLLLLYIQDELSFDRFHKNSDNIYRMINNNSNSTYFAPQVSGLLVENFPEIIESTRILPRDDATILYEDEQFNETDFTFADANFFEIFSFRLINGDPESALRQPLSIVINESISVKYFGNNDPIGKILKVSNEFDYIVTGVMADFPANSHFNSNFIATLVGADKVFGEELMKNWGWQNFLVYSLFEENFSVSSVETKYPTLFLNYMDAEDPNLPNISLQNLNDVHLYSSYLNNDIRPQGDITFVLIFSGIGALILLIACFNYIYLLTANAASRAAEVGIKKVIGATRKQLAVQFFSESIVVLFFSLIISLVIVVMFLPFFNTLTGKLLSLTALLNKNMIAGIIGIVVITGFLAGSYPALFISAFQPIHAVKGNASFGKSKFSFNRLLVVMQFTISAILIICSVFMFRQLHFIQNKELGFNKEHIVIIQNHEAENRQKFELFKNTLLQNNQIINIASADRIPSGDLNNWCGFGHEDLPDGINMRVVHVSFDYFKTLGIDKALHGRLFINELETDISDVIILNEAAVKELELNETPIGKEILVGWPHSKRTVVGVVKDFHFESLYKDIHPAAFVILYPECSRIMVKINSSDIEKTLADIEKTWKEMYPSWTYEYRFMDDRFEQIYLAEKRTFQLLGYFSLLAIFIACIGLFGLTSFTTKRRFKEIGVRKVLGASITQIISMLSLDFIKWVAIANIIACPVAWYAMDKWFQHFAFHIEISWWTFALTGLCTVFIALFTVSWQSYSAAANTPVDSLRYE